MEVRSDPRRGHIALVRGSETVVTFTDLGSVLQVWQHGNGVELTEQDARALAAALYGWANRKAKGRVRSA